MAFAILADTDVTQNVDVFKFCSVISFALRKSLTCAKIMPSFEKCRLWAVNCTRVISVPRPRGINDVQNLAAVDEMHELFQKKTQNATYNFNRTPCNDTTRLRRHDEVSFANNRTSYGCCTWQSKQTLNETSRKREKRTPFDLRTENARRITGARLAFKLL